MSNIKKPLKDKNTNANNGITTAQVVMTRSGPIPPPSELAEYNQISPGLAEKIVNLAWAQSEHRMALENFLVKKDHALKSRGQIFAFVIAFLGIVVGAAVMFTGQTITSNIFGGIFGIGGLAMIVIAFLQHKNQPNK